MTKRSLAVLAGAALVVDLALVPLARALPVQPDPSSIRIPMKTQNSPVLQAMKKGAAALDAGDLSGAELAFNEAHKQDPKAVGPMIGLAEVYLKKKLTADAETQLKQALALQPGSAEVHAAMGRLLLGKTHYPQAEDEFKKAISLNKNFYPAIVSLGELYLFAQNKPKDAEGAFRQALSVKSDYEPARVGLGIALGTQGQYDEALKELYDAARSAPADPSPFHLIGRIYAKQQKYDQAIQAFGDALRIKSNYYPALYDRADVYSESKKVPEAIRDYQQILHDFPADGVAQMKLGMAYQRADRLSEAESSYLAAVKADPKLSVAYNNLAMIALARAGRNADALTWAKKAVELGPKVAQFHDTLGWVYRAGGEKSKALDELEAASHMDPPQAEIFYHYGVVAQEAGKTLDAMAAFRRALQLQSDYPDAKQALNKLETTHK